MLEYILVIVGGALGTGARFWVSGFVAERGGEFFPLGTLVVNITGSFAVGFFAAFMDPEGSFLISPWRRQFFMIVRVWRLHNVFVLQLANTRSGSRWRLVQSRPEYPAFIVCCLAAVWLGRILALAILPK